MADIPDLGLTKHDLYLVFGFLDLDSLLRCRGVCQYWKSLLRADFFWQTWDVDAKRPAVDVEVERIFCNKVLTLNPGNPQALIIRAVGHDSTEYIDGLKTDCRALIAAHPDSPEALLAKALIWEAEEKSQGKQFTLAACDRFPNDIRSQIFYAYDLAQESDLQGVRKVLTGALERCPERYLIFRCLCLNNLATVEAELDATLVLLGQAVDLAPHYTRARIQRARRTRETSPDFAKADLNFIINDPLVTFRGRAEAYTERSSVRLSWRHAIKDCEKALALDPDNSLAWALAASYLADHESLSAAIEKCKEGLRRMSFESIRLVDLLEELRQEQSLDGLFAAEEVEASPPPQEDN